MSFAQHKQSLLSKPDKSRQGGIDEGIKPLVSAINALPDYFTASSCAGRCVLLNLYGARKNQSRWLFKSHREVKPSELIKVLEDAEGLKGSVWLKFEPFILHVHSRTEGAAFRLLKLARACGLKKAGIISGGNTYVLEIEGNDRLEVLVWKQGFRISPQDLRAQVSELNRKHKSNKKKLGRLLSSLKPWLTSPPAQSL